MPEQEVRAVLVDRSLVEQKIKQVEAGEITINQMRESFGLAPVVGGDVLVEPETKNRS